MSTFEDELYESMYFLAKIERVKYQLSLLIGDEDYKEQIEKVTARAFELARESTGSTRVYLLDLLDLIIDGRMHGDTRKVNVILEEMAVLRKQGMTLHSLRMISDRIH